MRKWGKPPRNFLSIFLSDVHINPQLLITIFMAQAKPNSLSATVVTMVDEAVTAVGKDLAAMRKQGLHERNFFTQTGMSGAEKMRCCLSALVILALLIFFIFNLNHQY